MHAVRMCMVSCHAMLYVLYQVVAAPLTQLCRSSADLNSSAPPSLRPMPLRMRAHAGERLSPWVGVSCVVMGFSILFT
jgi:hypothetical protein